MVSREKIHELVGLFYQPMYKTFYINSEDGKEFSKPQGVFVSLGMTTSRRTMENIRDFLAGRKYSAKIVEISSNKVGDQFLNTVTNSDNPQQYRLEDVPSNVLTKEQVYGELEFMKNRMSPASSLETLTEHSHKVNKLQYLADRLEESNGWDSHMIQRDGDSDYRIYHLYVNYEKREGIEYRLGILVDENENNSEEAMPSN